MSKKDRALQVFESVESVRSEVAEQRSAGRRISLVPTMGYLHEGHQSLIEAATRRSDYVVVSSFVNPTQFNEASDFESYPRDPEHDLRMIEEAGGNAVFLPRAEELYPPGFQSVVALSQLPQRHEGERRPGHFSGVTSVVSMLFNIVLPDIAFFGEKDFQQLRIVEQMVADLKFPVEIVRGELIRAEDGLALSSRNSLLSSTQRQQACLISKGLFAAQKAFVAGERSASKLVDVVSSCLTLGSELLPEYVVVVRESDLEPVQDVGNEASRILVAARVGKVRLIDNIALTF